MLKNQRNNLLANAVPQPLRWADCHLPHTETVYPGTRSQSDRTPLPSKGNHSSSANRGSLCSAPALANTTPAPLPGSGRSFVQFQGAKPSSHSTSPFYFARVFPVSSPFWAGSPSQLTAPSHLGFAAGPPHLAHATLPETGARVTVSVRRMVVHLPQSFDGVHLKSSPPYSKQQFHPDRRSRAAPDRSSRDVHE